jgi:hypothetical protein
VRIGLVGYGKGGRFFHAPLIAAAAGCELAGVVTRSAERRGDLERDHPGIPAHDDVGAFDGQADELMAGGSPAASGGAWGVVPRERWAASTPGTAQRRHRAGGNTHRLAEIQRRVVGFAALLRLRLPRGPAGRQPIRQELHPAAAGFVSDDDRRFVVGDCV